MGGILMKIPEDEQNLKSRILNAKFKQALQYADWIKNQECQELILILARRYGDSGWIFGDEGEFQTYLIKYFFHLQGWEWTE